jgi:hypothetical protein
VVPPPVPPPEFPPPVVPPEPAPEPGVVVVGGAELLLEDDPVPPQPSSNTIQIANRNITAINDAARLSKEPPELIVESH